MDCEHIREQLEAYALDALDPAERSAIERHLATCDDCRKEAAVLAELVALFPTALANGQPALIPAGDLRNRVMAAAAATRSRRTSRSVRNDRRPEFSSEGPDRTSRSAWRALALAAPAFLLILSLVWGFRLAVALERERDLRAEYADLLEDAVSKQEPVFEVIGFDDTSRQFLRAQQPDSTSYGKVFTRPSMPYVVVMAGRLPDAPSGSSFHVWVTSNGQTRLAGELTVDEHGFGLLVFTENEPGPVYETAFVTLQPTGTNTPDGTEILGADNPS